MYHINKIKLAKNMYKIKMSSMNSGDNILYHNRYLFPDCYDISPLITVF